MIKQDSDGVEVVFEGGNMEGSTAVGFVGVRVCVRDEEAVEKREVGFGWLGMRKSG